MHALPYCKDVTLLFIHIFTLLSIHIFTMLSFHTFALLSIHVCTLLSIFQMISCLLVRIQHTQGFSLQRTNDSRLSPSAPWHTRKIWLLAASFIVHKSAVSTAQWPELDPVRWKHGHEADKNNQAVSRNSHNKKIKTVIENLPKKYAACLSRRNWQATCKEVKEWSISNNWHNIQLPRYMGLHEKP